MNHLRKKILRAANLLEDPDRASQQPECNDPAPPYPACLFWSQTRTARYVIEILEKKDCVSAVSGVRVMGNENKFSENVKFWYVNLETNELWRGARLLCEIAARAPFIPFLVRFWF